MLKEYNFSNSDREKGEQVMLVVNVCKRNGVESGIPEEEQDAQNLDSKGTVVLYTEALKNNTAIPVFVGMPHSGEFAPKEIFDRIAEPKAFVDGLDVGIANFFSPRLGENYVAARNKISRLIADPNRGPRQFSQGKGVGGVTWMNNFQEKPIYKPGREPTDDEVAENVDAFYNPYYRALHALVASLHETRGYNNILFLDAHSFPGTMDVPKIGLVGSESKPLFILGSQGSAKASAEVMRMLTGALTRYAPAKEKFPDMYKYISDIIREESEFGWGGAHNVVYFGHPEGTDADVASPKIHAVQLEMNQSAFYEDGKYNDKHVEALRQTIQKALREVGDTLKQLQL